MKAHGLRYSAVFASALVALGTLSGVASPAHAQDWARATLDKSPRHGEYVTIHEPGGRSLQAWVVYPETKSKAPVVVMIHEIFGLTDWAREMADETAAAGYIVVEPDLLSGYGPSGAAAGTAPQVPTSAEHAAHDSSPAGQQQAGAALAPATPGGTAAFPDQSAVVKAVSALPPAGVLADLNATADYARHLPAAGARLFVAGFCWGGGQSFLFATHRHDLSAALVFYGPPPPPQALSGISAPVYGFYGANDARITATVDQTKADMKAAGKSFEPVVYDGAGHGFMRAGEAPDATAPNAAARQAAFRRMIQLLGGMH